MIRSLIPSKDYKMSPVTKGWTEHWFKPFKIYYGFTSVAKRWHEVVIAGAGCEPYVVIGCILRVEKTP